MFRVMPNQALHWRLAEEEPCNYRKEESIWISSVSHRSRLPDADRYLHLPIPSSNISAEQNAKPAGQLGVWITCAGEGEAATGGYKYSREGQDRRTMQRRGQGTGSGYRGRSGRE